MGIYEKEIEDIEDEFDTSVEEGLSEKEVRERKEKYGLNRIEIKEPPSWLSLFLRHLKEFVSILLLIVGTVALVTYFLGHGGGLEHLAESVIIYAIVIINASVGAYQEHKSEQTAQRLREMIKTEAKVIRDGGVKEINSEEVVPGDIVWVESGDKIPADMRLVETDELEAQESVLTGESGAVQKDTEVINEERPLAERNDMAYMNTHITRGKGKGIVVATGADTEAGSIAEASKEEEEEDIPFLEEVGETGRTISKLALSLVAIASLVFLLYGKSYYQVFMLAAALIIGSIPAALPVTVTYSLSNAAKKMAEKNALIKNLPMIETLGGVDVICTDKTGTLTKNEMAVKKFFISGDVLEAEELDKDEHQEIIRCALTANEAEKEKGKEGYIGSPEDVGLYEYLQSIDVNIDEMKDGDGREDFLPFSSERMMAQALVDLDGGKVRYMKGAPEVILERSDKIWVDGEIKELTEEWEDKIKNSIDDFSEEALRNLAFSYKDVEDEGLGTDTDGDVFLGIVGMWDPPKEGVKEAIQTCYDAGIEVKMITGDSKETAEAVAEECGMKDISTVTWHEVKDVSDEEMKKIVQENNVFARMDPELKMNLVNTLHELDKSVAITGDGVNDTPPMKTAEVGVAMGDRGSDITRDAADIILLDDHFADMPEAIRYGRASLSNVRKVVNYLLTANVFEVIVLFISALMGFAPFVALQLLWVNFATDIFPAIGLGADPPHPDIMEKKPTGKKEKILTKRVWYLLGGIGLKKVVMIFVTFFMVFTLSEGSTNIMGLTGNLRMAQTSAFVWLGLSHVVRIAAIRWDEGWKWKDVFINNEVNLALLWPLFAKLSILYIPLGGFALAHFFHATPLPLWAWRILVTTLGISVILAILIAKVVHLILGEYGEREY